LGLVEQVVVVQQETAVTILCLQPSLQPEAVGVVEVQLGQIQMVQQVALVAAQLRITPVAREVEPQAKAIRAAQTAAHLFMAAAVVAALVVLAGRAVETLVALEEAACPLRLQVHQ
jgi:hypothetical protein